MSMVANTSVKNKSTGIKIYSSIGVNTTGIKITGGRIQPLDNKTKFDESWMYSIDYQDLMAMKLALIVKAARLYSVRNPLPSWSGTPELNFNLDFNIDWDAIGDAMMEIAIGSAKILIVGLIIVASSYAVAQN